MQMALGVKEAGLRALVVDARLGLGCRWWAAFNIGFVRTWTFSVLRILLFLSTFFVSNKSFRFQNVLHRISSGDELLLWCVVFVAGTVRGKSVCTGAGSLSQVQVNASRCRGAKPSVEWQAARGGILVRVDGK